MDQLTPLENQTNLNTLCFFSQCRQRHQQIVGSRVELHSSHTQQLESLSFSSVAFGPCAHFPQKNCKENLMKQKEIVKEYLDKIQLQILQQLREWRKKQLTKLNCLIDFFDRDRIIEIFKNFNYIDCKHQEEYLQIINMLYDLSKQQLEDSNSHFSALTDKLVQCLIGCSKKGNNILEIVKYVLQSHEYNELNLGDESFHLQAQAKAKDLKAILHKQKKIGQMFSSQESEQSGGFETLFSKNQKQSKDSAQKIFQQLSYEQKTQKLVDNPILSKTAYTEQDSKGNDELKQTISTYLSKSKQISKKEVCTRKNYGKKHYPILIEDNQAEKIKRMFQIGKNKNYKTQQILEIPQGLQTRGEQILIIWNGRNKTQIMNFILQHQKLKYLIINDKSISSQHIQKFLTINPSIQGITFNCQNFLRLKDFLPYKLRFLNCFENFRFIREKDNAKYFPWKKCTFRQKADETVKQIKCYAFQSYTLRNIPPNLKQLNFCQLQEILCLNLSLNSSVISQKINCLQILTFSNIKFPPSSYSLLRILFKSNQRLRNISFSHCEIKLQTAVDTFENVNSEYLSQLVFQGAQGQKQTLSQKSRQQIGSFHHLQVLILVNILFSEKQTQAEKFSAFPEISSLKNLNHLNLYNCQPVYADLLQYLHPSTYQNMKTLNLGLTQINSKAVPLLSKFTGLQALVLDFVQISGKDLVSITREMARLAKLSLCGLSSRFSSQMKREYPLPHFGGIKSQDIQNFAHKTLEYVNIGGCDYLRSHQWFSFPRLKIIKVSYQQLSDQAKDSLKLLKIRLFQQEKWSSFQISKFEFLEGKRKVWRKQQARSKLKDIQQIDNNSIEGSSNSLNTVTHSYLNPSRQSQRVNQRDKQVKEESALSCQFSQEDYPNSKRSKSLGKSHQTKSEMITFGAKRVQKKERKKGQFDVAQV